MNNISIVLDRIITDAEKTRAKKVESAQKSAADRKRLYEKEANLEAKEIIAAGEKEAAAVIQRGKSQAGIQKRNYILLAKREVLDIAFHNAVERLNSLTETEKENYYYKKIFNSKPEGKVEITLCEEDRNLGANLLQRLGAKCDNCDFIISNTFGDFKGGILVKCVKFQSNFTFEAMCEAIKDELEIKAAEMLFNQEESFEG